MKFRGLSASAQKLTISQGSALKIQQSTTCKNNGSLAFVFESFFVFGFAIFKKGFLLPEGLEVLKTYQGAGFSGTKLVDRCSQLLSSWPSTVGAWPPSADGDVTFDLVTWAACWWRCQLAAGGNQPAVFSTGGFDQRGVLGI